ncbi:hypothetical protein MYCTH_2310585 [Thermothelomyces thermophilus ATCC 42464]|uniref:Uncharacterized protein n=1 Tax=Thermothelomyces thermophilus (strain ATCC 42464 / BCRC 31852 / DSM 1799) TaxID=573729 RepID=G2QLP9_THET4|nr:uncharacterized protein MYCTH_2310585 [Thermothelomyces thermophilus ATCC 42464]AEO60879.1 hypothetical protein MYCTH_2310585 [Thermothelomyces thermophilus ATCC 42464]
MEARAERAAPPPFPRRLEELRQARLVPPSWLAWESPQIYPASLRIPVRDGHH